MPTAYSHGWSSEKISLRTVFVKASDYFVPSSKQARSWDSSVGIATSYGLDGRVSIPGRSTRIFVHSVQTGSVAHPPIQWVPGAVSFGVRRLGHGTDHSPPFNAEVNNGGAIRALSHTP
jgi:hypothetical protein